MPAAVLPVEHERHRFSFGQMRWGVVLKNASLKNYIFVGIWAEAANTCLNLRLLSP